MITSQKLLATRLIAQLLPQSCEPNAASLTAAAGQLCYLIDELYRQRDAQHRYIAELERQLEPSVLHEIRSLLSHEPASHP